MATNTNNNSLTISSIPNEVLSHNIFSWIEVEDVINISTVCKRWSIILINPRTLHAIYNNLYAKIPESFSDKLNYRALLVSSAAFKKVVDFCEFHKTAPDKTAKQKQAISVEFAKLNPKHQIQIKKLISIHINNQSCPGAYFKEDKLLLNSPKSPAITNALQQFISDDGLSPFDKCLAKFIDAVKDKTKTKEEVLEPFYALKENCFGEEANLAYAIEAKLYELVSNGSTDFDFGQRFIENNPHSATILIAIDDVMNNQART